MYQEAGVGLLAISADDAEASATFARELEIEFPLLADADLTTALAYGVAMEDRDIAVPSIFVVSREGLIVYQHVGENMADRPSGLSLLRRAKEARKQAP